MKRVICALLCAVMLVCSLTGCLEKFDAKAFVQGNLDVIYLNKITDEHLNSVTNSREDLEAVYQKGIEIEAEYFASYFYFDLELAPEGTFERIVELYKQIYTYAKYEISEAEQAEDDYLLTVTVYPIDIIVNVIKEDWEAFEADYLAASEQGTELTPEEQEALWVDGVLSLFEERIPTIGYLEPQTVSITVTKGEDGVYYVSDNDFGRIDTLVIQYKVD